MVPQIASWTLATRNASHRKSLMSKRVASFGFEETKRKKDVANSYREVFRVGRTAASPSGG